MRELRDQVRFMAFLVGMRTKIKNRIHSELAKRGLRLGVPPFTREGRALLQGLGIEAVVRLLPVLDTLNGQIAQVSAGLKRMCGEDPRASLLTTIPGVGYYVALLLVAEIGDVNRFPDSESLCSYAGLVPTVWQSGGSTWHGGITREGSKCARARVKPKQVVLMATARKMLKVIYWMLRNDEPYHPGRAWWTPWPTARGPDSEAEMRPRPRCLRVNRVI